MQEVYRVAVIHQGAPPPPIGGVLKPVKPGGYKDSCADVSYALSQEQTAHSDIRVITPAEHPDPAHDSDWSFPDTKSSILEAIEKRGANVIWANTNVHSSHPLLEVAKLYPEVRMVGQDPRQVDLYDDKAWAHTFLRKRQDLEDAFPQVWILPRGAEGEKQLEDIPLPVIMKPVRGRGSQGVKMVEDRETLRAHAEKLWETGERIVIEAFLQGEEITVTVLPPGEYDAPVGVKKQHWALPVVRRFDQTDGVMPYSGVTPVSANSALVPLQESDGDPEYARVMRRCESVAEALGVLATIRIDARRRGIISAGNAKQFALFDINMKPNITGPGRPGRDEQIALTAMAADGIGWTYGDLVRNMLRQAVRLRCLL